MLIDTGIDGGINNAEGARKGLMGEEKSHQLFSRCFPQSTVAKPVATPTEATSPEPDVISPAAGSVNPRLQQLPRQQVLKTGRRPHRDNCINPRILTRRVDYLIHRKDVCWLARWHSDFFFPSVCLSGQMID